MTQILGRKYAVKSGQSSLGEKGVVKSGHLTFIWQEKCCPNSSDIKILVPPTNGSTGIHVY